MSKEVLKLSVITVCYNAGHLLRKTIETVLEQTYECIEYIIIDGASCDSTVEVVNSYGDQIDRFISEPDGSLYEAMNKGITLASGELVIFLNAGDYYVSKDVVKFAISKMDFTRADLFFARFVWNDPRSSDIVLSDHHWVRYTWDLKESNFPHPGTFYKKNLFEKNGLFDTSYSIAADFEWNLRTLVKNKIPFQYIDIITAVFFADGISNNESTAVKCVAEISRIYSVYFTPNWLYAINLKHDDRSKFKKYLKKVLARIYECRLNRIY